MMEDPWLFVWHLHLLLTMLLLLLLQTPTRPACVPS
jgi:hypothetical protein